MNKEESLALFKRGKDAWNAWAEDLHFKKAKLKNLAKWDAAKEGWKRAATVDFTAHTFEDRARFVEFIFPYAVFFNDAVFQNGANFDLALFEGEAHFPQCSFYVAATFLDAIYSEEVDFENAVFRGKSMFSRTQFLQRTNFANASFENAATFESAIFSGSTTFEGARFLDKTSKNERHNYYANFSGILSSRIFSLEEATFSEAPDFGQAHFSEPPSLDRAKFATTRLKDPSKAKPSRWRHLRRLATQGHDHENEQKFFAAELRSRRGVTDFRFGNNWQRRWFGDVYDFLSDFGHSILRPTFWWFGSVLAFAYAYLLQNSLLKFGDKSAFWNFECFDSNANPIAAAANLSLSRASVLGSLSDSDAVARSFQCLFGTDNSLIAPNAPKLHIPDWVIFAGYGQSLFSAVMIFLILLALRNHFRIH